MPKDPRMARRVGLAIVCLLSLAGSAWAQGSGSDPSERKRALDSRIAQVRGELSSVDSKQAVLTSEIEAASSRIQGIQDDVNRATSRLGTLESELAAYEERLAKLTELLRLQTRKLELLRRQHRIAERLLAERLVDIYESDEPTTVEVLLTATSLTELVDALDYVDHLGRQDRRISRTVARAKEAVRVTRERTAATRQRVERTTEAVRARVEEQRAVQERLLASQAALSNARESKRRTLAGITAEERELHHELDGLEQASASLAAAIQTAQSSASPAPSSGGAAGGSSSSGGVSARGFIWPVSGAVTSGFGWRWGRMHEGIDIAAPSGTPIRATAAGTVIYSGWMSGYGNLVIIDHGGGLATAYAHQSTIGVGNGQQVVQGQTIGYVGCTGHCFGDHLHFEVRVNGAAVDPLGYL